MTSSGHHKIPVCRLLFLVGSVVLGLGSPIIDFVGVDSGVVPVHAAEPTLEQILNSLGFTNIVETTDETFPPGSYEIQLLAEYATHHATNTVSHYSVGKSDFQILIAGPAGNVGMTNPQISLIFVQDHAFGLSFQDVGRFFTDTARNPDGIKHTKIFKDPDHPGTFLIGFEDLFGGGDIDFNDMVVRLTPIQGSVG